MRIKHDSTTAIGREFGGQTGTFVRKIDHYGLPCVLIDMPKAVPKWARSFSDIPYRLVLCESQVDWPGEQLPQPNPEVKP